MITSIAASTLFYFSSFFCTEEACNYTQVIRPVTAEQCERMGEGFKQGIATVKANGVLITRAGWKCTPAKDAAAV